MRLDGIRTTMLLAVLMAGPAADATAQGWMITPYAGAGMGRDAPAAKPTAGVSVGWIGPAHLGVEADVATTFGFFSDPDRAIDFYESSRVTQINVNALYARPVGGRLTPYATAGLGGLYLRATDPAAVFSIDRTDFAANVGGGAWLRLSSMAAIRADVRYFTSLEDDGEGFQLHEGRFDFVRLTGGITLSF